MGVIFQNFPVTATVDCLLSYVKFIFSEEDITPGAYRYDADNDRNSRIRISAPFSIDNEKPLSAPFVVKPKTEGSSVGLSVIRDAEDLPGALCEAFKYGDTALVEEFIKGRELIKFLETLDFKVTRTKGSHSRLKSENTKEISNKFLNLS